ncbi:MAG: helix-turn-helix domain-containing protein, partial [Peptostreptococcaceae bacterium]|nr:helix-turn-helix domain-containing protein [Peptostreptococcaceae bacterium]
MSYDIKFKQRAVEYQREGHTTYKETCKVFKISETTLTRWINKEKEGKLGEVK